MNNNKATVPCLKECAFWQVILRSNPITVPRLGELSPQKEAFNKSVREGRASMEITLWWKQITHLQSQVKWLVIIRDYFRKIKGKLGISEKHRRGAMMGQEGVKQPGGWVLASILPHALWPQWNLASLSVLRFWNTRIPQNLRHYCFNNMKSMKISSSKKSEDIYSLILMSAFKNVEQAGPQSPAL